MEVVVYKSDYEALVSNPIWKEIVATLEEVMEGLISDLSELDPKEEMTNLARQQGRKAMVEFVLGLPSRILEEIEAEQKKLEEKTEDEL